MDPQEQARIDEIAEANRKAQEELARLQREQEERARQEQQQPPAHP
jgi:hypothetical protein